MKTIGSRSSSFSNELRKRVEYIYDELVCYSEIKSNLSGPEQLTIPHDTTCIYRMNSFFYTSSQPTELWLGKCNSFPIYLPVISMFSTRTLWTIYGYSIIRNPTDAEWRAYFETVKWEFQRRSTFFIRSALDYDKW